MEGSDRGSGAGIVFVVDDDASVCEALNSLLRAVGWQVRTFTSAAFLAFVRPDLPACMVLDVRLPDASGLDLQHQLAGRAGAPPIIFMSSYGDIPMTVQAMKAGAVEFLPKPFCRRTCSPRSTVRSSAMSGPAPITPNWPHCASA